MEYGYDHRGMLVTAKQTVGSTVSRATYSYDSSGNQIARADVNTTHWSVYDGWDTAKPPGAVGTENFDRWATLREGDGMLVERRYYGSGWDEYVAKQWGRGGGLFWGDMRWSLTDHQGSLRRVLDRAGEVKGTKEYNSFGVTGVPTGELEAIGYTGREWDGALRLQHSRARMYDPTTARWYTTDPKGFDAGDANLYRYVGNGVTTRTDPSGMQPPTMQPQLKAPAAANPLPDADPVAMQMLVGGQHQAQTLATLQKKLDDLLEKELLPAIEKFDPDNISVEQYKAIAAGHTPQVNIFGAKRVRLVVDQHEGQNVAYVFVHVPLQYVKTGESISFEDGASAYVTKGVPAHYRLSLKTTLHGGPKELYKFAWDRADMEESAREGDKSLAIVEQTRVEEKIIRDVVPIINAADKFIKWQSGEKSLLDVGIAILDDSSTLLTLGGATFAKALAKAPKVAKILSVANVATQGLTAAGRFGQGVHDLNFGNGEKAQQYFTESGLRLLLTAAAFKQYKDLTKEIARLSQTTQKYRIVKPTETVNIGRGDALQHFTDVKGVSGITGVPEDVLVGLKPGEIVVVDAAHFKPGVNPYLSGESGGVGVTKAKLSEMTAYELELHLKTAGVPPDRRGYVIEFSQETVVQNGISLRADSPAKSIWSLAGDTKLNGTITIKKIK